MTRRFILALALCVVGAGCVHAQRFRYVQNQPECFPGSAADPLPGVAGEKRQWSSLDCRHTLYAVGYVEFDEDGNAVDPTQEEKALRLIEQVRNRAPGGRIITVVYVHGWKNNASESQPGDKPKDVEKFHTALLELGYRSRHVADRTGSRTPLPVVGVYMGWRGKTLMGPDWFTFLSYWGRRNAANRVGGNTGFAQTLTRVIAKVNEAATGSRVMLIGHSFGARVLEHAIEKQQVALYKPGGTSDVLEPLVDLALYVNSANDARLSMARVAALRDKPIRIRHPDYQPTACQEPEEAHSARCREYPLLVAITSRGDLATKYLLPTANTLNLDKSASTPVSPSGEYLDPIPKGGIYRRAAAAHLKFLQSHSVREIACPGGAKPTALRAEIRTPEQQLAEAVDRAVAKALGKEAELKAIEEQAAKQKAAARRAEEERLERVLRPACADGDENCRFVFRTPGERPACFQVDQRTGDVGEGGTKLSPFNNTSFWIMDVDTRVIKDHGDIWNLAFVEMLAQLMAPRGFFEPDTGRIQMRIAPSR